MAGDYSKQWIYYGFDIGEVEAKTSTGKLWRKASPQVVQ